MSDSPFIVVFRPHQRRGWAETFSSEAEFHRLWINGHFDLSCNANGDNADIPDDPTFDDAWQDVGHDLHCLDRLDSAEEVESYLKRGGHNVPYSAVEECAVELGWFAEDDEEDADDDEA